jgi:hypothetical protein
MVSGLAAVPFESYIPAIQQRLKFYTHAGVPPVLIRLVALVFLVISDPLVLSLDHLETFAGTRACSNAFVGFGRCSIPLDVVYDPILHDFNGDAGYAHVCALATKLYFGAAYNSGPVCSSWTYLNSGTACRSMAFPLGNTFVFSVRFANKMVSRQILLVYLLLAHGAFFFIEQPKGSRQEWHDRFQDLFRKVRMYRHLTKLWSFGSPYEKCIWLYSPWPWIAEIDDFQVQRLPGDMPLPLARYVYRNGICTVEGNECTKDSQHYPEGFGRAFALLYKRHELDIKLGAQRYQCDIMNAVRNDATDIDLVSDMCESDAWCDADLFGSFSYLRSQRD